MTLASPPVPTATYRLQLQPEFGFEEAVAALPYLSSLGVSHLHLSPLLEAVPGSTHGYDVVDHSRVRAELGGEDGLRRLASAARGHGLGLVADIVPNHMAVPAPERLNRPLWEVLREGPESPYARWFDIDWTRHDGRILMPVLEDRLGRELRRLEVHGDVLRYRAHEFPLRPGTERLPLPELLRAQHYRLGWWRLARTELNYRRFFTVSGLIGLRVEDPVVFDATHAKMVDLVRDGVLEGLRVDHPDGLADPRGYLRRLEQATLGRCWTVVEKILADGERLPEDWPVAGTTGYDALRHIDGVFVDPEGAAELARRYAAFTGAPPDRGGQWRPTLRRAAWKVVAHELVAEVDRLTRVAGRICAADPRLHDIAPWALGQAVREMLVRIPVYRPYAQPGEEPSPGDEMLLERVAERARRTFAVPGEADAADMIRDAALGRLGDSPDHRDFAARFAQTSAALHAKATEDRAFYRFPALLSACEVGGDPGGAAVSPGDFHAFSAGVQRDRPHTGTVLTTHDTKRSADVRARTAVLSEYAAEWADFVAATDAHAARFGPPAPDAHVAWLAWQTAYGVGFPHPDQVKPALLKAVREAGLRTSWTEPRTDYEEAVAAFADNGPCGPSMYATQGFANERDAAVTANELGAALLHLTMPGVPDVYQCTEARYRALVDPDNRRPAKLPDRPYDPAAPNQSDVKRRLTATALRLRKAHPQWFDHRGTYEPVAAPDHMLAFTRSGAVLTAVTRLAGGLERAGGWGDAELELPEGEWRDLLRTAPVLRGRVRAAELFAELPVALLVAEGVTG
ncbi:Maltooligosyl trehalose synthase [Streptomyces sp. RB5]|uniref:Maltooligosyl trehalose synthase n=1 Tax=Streptomyces smaragdinus TaxID=2585196 RepID=A0A7K0CRY3_9ACTN|nr:malto-oligosyltrehalose synthase [Streptomyces smaragdinus]MQY16255.1 Maltooligosyl trehalose synthase [Streptomyces smaragdinus]